MIGIVVKRPAVRVDGWKTRCSLVPAHFSIELTSNGRRSFDVLSVYRTSDLQSGPTVFPIGFALLVHLTKIERDLVKVQTARAGFLPLLL